MGKSQVIALKQQIEDDLDLLIEDLIKPMKFSFLPADWKAEITTKEKGKNFLSLLAERKIIFTHKTELIDSISSSFKFLGTILRLIDETDLDSPYEYLHISKEKSLEEIKERVSMLVAHTKTMLDNPFFPHTTPEVVNQKVMLAEFALHRIKKMHIIQPTQEEE